MYCEGFCKVGQTFYFLGSKMLDVCDQTTMLLSQNSIIDSLSLPRATMTHDSQDYGWGSELANYGEYSGAPSTEECEDGRSTPE